MLQKSTAESTKTIYIIRHGQTDFNKQGIVQGSGIDSDLNETGIQQALGFYEHYRDVTFSRAFVSALKRTHQTVAPFTNSGLEVEILEELNEINWGIMEGVHPTPENNEKFLETLNAWRNGLLDYAVENGETPNAMLARQKLGLEKVISQLNGNPVLICMHGRAMRSFLCLLTGTPLQQMDDFEHGNVCLYILDKYDSEAHFRIRVRNSRAHLHDHLK